MQAARGTSLSDATGPSEPTPRSRRRLWLLFAAVALVGYVTDVVSKIVAVERLSGRPDVEVVGELLVLHLTRNPGAAFSLGTDFTVVLSLVSVAAAVAIAVMVRRVGSAVWAVGLGLLLAGVTGNLTDRLLREPGPLRGHVIDFLMLPNWPVFNVADMCIVTAAGLIMLQAVRGVGLDGRRHDEDAEDAEGEAS